VTTQSTMENITTELAALRESAERTLPSVSSDDAIEQARLDLLGKKGKLTAILRGMGGLDAKERPVVGKTVNEVRDRIEGLLADAQARIAAQARQGELSLRDDVTLPGRRHQRGHKHPLTKTAEDILDVLASLGFHLAEGPEIEHDFYNFEALNIPRDHPARDMQDTFYVANDVVLRTHTSPVQIRAMLTLEKPPVRVACYGRVYRNDHDITHSPMFHQIEGLYIDKNVTFADLKGTLQVFAERMFAKGTKVRMRPSFFPFTEPSAEVDISCFQCEGSGKLDGGAPCRLCKSTGFIEIMGAGMVDPEVFKAVGLDPEVVTGFAFGVGVERVAMLRYGVHDIRLFYENDHRFLSQFF
jgi:phenylalanyl-tRNA synthetase alpha chain